jgi:signal transduction histidine kinase/CheY-like chemotaxis protein
VGVRLSMAATVHDESASGNSLRGNAFIACLGALALGMLAAVVLMTSGLMSVAGAAAVGVVAGAAAAVPLSRWAVASTSVRLATAAVRADILSNDLLPPPGDDLDRLTARLEQLGSRLRHEESMASAARRAAEEAEAGRAEFLAAMNHELRTPLNAILGFGQVLGMTTLAADQRECLDQVLRGGRHLLRLVNELLQISQIEGGRVELSPEPVFVREVVAEVLELIQPMAAHRRIVIDATGQGDAPWWVIADRHRLKQVLLNLFSNAIKFNHEAGRIVARATAASGRVRISVSDTGPGLLDEQRARLFSPFDRLGADRVGIEGAGLGLALAKGLVERMGGTIGVSSAPGAGSTFWVEFAQTPGPVVPGASDLARTLATPRNPSQPCATPRNGTQPHTHAIDVLQIEDNFANTHLVERVLAARHGLRVMTVTQGRLGLELAREHQPSLILLDLHLPDARGLDLLQALAADERTATIPVVVISADSTPGQHARALAAGARAVLAKPLDVARFMDVIDPIFLPPVSAS